MPKQTQRLVWRKARKDLGRETEARELWLHRRGEAPVQVGFVFYQWDKSWTGYWTWYATERPWADRPGERFYTSTSFETAHEAKEHLRSQPFIQQWPLKHCIFCTKLGCTDCEKDPFNRAL